MSAETCKICNSQLINYSLRLGKVDVYEIDCPCCGHYDVSESFLFSTSPSYSTEEMRLFSGYIRNTSSEEDPMFLTGDTYNNIQEIISPYKRLSVTQKINNLIKFIYDRADKPYKQILIKPDEIYRFYIHSIDDFYMIVNYLTEQNYIRNPSHTSAQSTFWVTVEGWRKYESLKETNINSKKVFVAMSFDSKLKPIFADFIKPACKECGFDAERVDSKEHNEKICDRIIAGINESRFVIADFTQNKHGVYFEAGYARGLGIPVIWTCSDTFKEELHFDTRQYNHIIWKDGKDLREQLVNRIKASININR